MSDRSSSMRSAERTAIGAWLNLPAPYIAEAASRMGFDFVVLDLQHGLISEDAALAMIQAIELGGATPTVRTRSAEAAHLGRMLDFGAVSLIVPMVDNVECAENIVSACRYAPVGCRSFGPTRVGLQHKCYHETGPSAVSIYPMIETGGALDDVEAIAALDGVSGVFTGPADLSMSLGLNPARDQSDPAFVEAIDRILSACRATGKTPGIQADSSVMAKRIDQGFTYVSVCMDSSDLCLSFEQSLKSARSLV